MAYFNYNKSNIARACKMSRQAIFYWHKNDEIPFLRQCYIEVITGGELKADKADAPNSEK